MYRYLAPLSVLAAACISLSAAAQLPPPPQSAVSPAIEKYWGVTVRDPYQWLEASSSPKVQAWIEAQNAYAQRIIEREMRKNPAAITKLVSRVRRLAITSTQKFAPQLKAGSLFYLRETPPQAQPVLVVQKWPGGEARVIVDPNKLGELTAITNLWPSADGRYVAYGLANAGTEDTTIRVVESATGRQLPDACPRAGGGTSPQALVWDADGRGFTYVRMPLRGSVPASELGFNAALYHHALGSASSADALVFGKGLSRVAEYVLLASSDATRAAAVVHFGDGSSDYVYARDRAAWQRFASPADGIQSWDDGTVSFDGRRLIAIATSPTPRGRVVELTSGGLRTIVPQGAWAMRSIAPIESGFLLTEVWGTAWRVRQFGEDGRVIRTLPLPSHGVGIDGIASDGRSPYAIVSYEGWATPPRWASYDARSGALTTVYALKTPGDYSNVAATELAGTAPDGTRVPVTVVALRGRRADSSSAILTAYGAYGLTTAPHFIGTGLAWLEAGGILAYANNRGGGEFGEAWHRNGALLNEEHRFQDFNAAARALIDGGWTSRERLGITGCSAGGLLMGGALVQAPQLYRAVVSFVGIYDVLRVERTPNGYFNVTEFGTVTNPDQFRAMYSYSPYHHVRDGVNYPAVLLITGVNDPRVAPWESWKMAARLQTATSSGLPVIVVTRGQAGHGIGASFSQRLGNTAAEMVFFGGELGL